MNTTTKFASTLSLLASLFAGGCAFNISTGDERTAHVPRSTANSIASEDFLTKYAESFRFRAGAPSSVEITPEGDAVLFLQSEPGSRVQDLYELDTSSGAVRVLLTAEEVLGGEEEQLSAEELARRERMRESARGIAGYSLSEDGRKILIPLSGRLYIVDRATREVRTLPEVEGFPIDPRFSPDGRKVASVYAGDLYVHDIEAGGVTRLTDTASDSISNGTSEFVAQEEMSRYRGYWWSPDSQRLAYQRTDESMVETVTILDPFDLGNEPQSWRYPRPGESNADVRVGVIPVTGGETTWLEWDRDAHEYLTTVRWTEGAPLTLVVQNRAQTEQVILDADPDTGSTRTLHREFDEAWLNIDQAVPKWINGGEDFLWMTERNGVWQLEVRDRGGEFVRAVNEPDFGLRAFIGVDEEKGFAYVTASRNPTESHVYALPLDGLGEPIDYTSHLGGVHGFEIEEGTDIAVHTVRSLEDTARTYVRRLGERSLGQVLAELPRNTPDPGFTPNLELTTVEGSETFHALLVRPRDFDPGKAYPVILRVYGGPLTQRVMASTERYLMDQWIADHGFIIARVDARGTPNRGRDWERTIKYDFINAPLDDQVEALNLLGEKYPEMDLDRVGVFGWSFGGYFSAMAAMRRPDVFDVAIAGAPVTDWQDYDTHYTERYIGVPGQDPRAEEAFRVSNVLTYADQLEIPLMIIHGTADDNVYLTHALKMSDALTRAGKDHRFMPLAGHTHMVVEPTIVKRMHASMMAFLLEHLRE